MHTMVAVVTVVAVPSTPFSIEFAGGPFPRAAFSLKSARTHLTRVVHHGHHHEHRPAPHNHMAHPMAEHHLDHSASRLDAIEAAADALTTETDGIKTRVASITALASAAAAKQLQLDTTGGGPVAGLRKAHGRKAGHPKEGTAAASAAPAPDTAAAEAAAEAAGQLAAQIEMLTRQQAEVDDAVARVTGDAAAADAEAVVLARTEAARLAALGELVAEAGVADVAPVLVHGLGKATAVSAGFDGGANKEKIGRAEATIKTPLVSNDDGDKKAKKRCSACCVVC